MGDADVRDRILAAATTLFANKGYGSTSVREVVEAAGVTKPTLYYHFESKEALFLHTVHTHLDQFGKLIDEAAASPGTVVQRLTWFAHRYVAESLAHADAVKLLITVKQPFDEEQPRVDIMSVHERHGRILARLVADGVERGELRPIDPIAATVTFIGALHLVVAGRLHGHPVPDGQIDAILDIFFHGAAA